uniref:Peptidase_S9 domain-containing protein n=1 Tax=Strongyloides papillosus TaxID=174720 RepID=A0A0N5BVD0_STREA
MRFVPEANGNHLSNDEIKLKISKIKAETKAGIPVKLSSPRVFSNLFNGKYKNVVVGLAPGPAPDSQHIYLGYLDMDREIRCNIELMPFSGIVNGSINNQRSSEAILLYERLRSTQLHGVNEYHVSHNERVMLLLAGGNVLQYDGCVISNRSTQVSKPIVRARLAPCNPEIIAMTEGKDIYVFDGEDLVYVSNSDSKYIYNGVSANVIQEELERYEGFWWSPTDPYLLYEEVDERGVSTTTLSNSADSEGTVLKYPFVNTPNPISSLNLLILKKNISGEPCISYVKRLTNKTLKTFWPWFEYIAKVGWTPDGEYIYLQLLDRLQTISALVLISINVFYNAEAAVFNKDIFEVVRIKGNPWINVNHHLECFYDSDKHAYGFIYGSEEKNFHHLFIKYAFIEKNTLYILEKAINLTFEDNRDFCIIKDIPIFVDEKRGNVFFVANYNEPGTHQLCYTNYRNENSPIVQITPSNRSVKYDRSTLTLDINPDLGFAVNISSISIRPKLVFFRCIDTIDGGFLVRQGPNIVHKESAPMVPDFRNSNIVIPQMYKYFSKQAGHDLYGCIFLPKCMDNDDTSVKYPVLQYVYNGPCAQLVQNNWDLTAKFQMYLVHNIAVVIVDGRGSANRGKDFESSIHKKFGTVEVEDQIEYLHVVNKNVANNRLDLEKVVIQGWSYGGFMSVRCLQKAPNVYLGAIAGGTVTDWFMYDTIYTERYMGLPSSNESKCHYSESSLLNDVDKLPIEPNRLLLVHGKLDDNVHFTHIEKLILKLEECKRPYELVPLPNERHGVKSPQTGEMLEVRYINFLNKLFCRC